MSIVHIELNLLFSWIAKSTSLPSLVITLTTQYHMPIVLILSKHCINLIQSLITQKLVQVVCLSAHFNK